MERIKMGSDAINTKEIRNTSFHDYDENQRMMYSDTLIMQNMDQVIYIENCLENMK